MRRLPNRPATASSGPAAKSGSLTRNSATLPRRSMSPKSSQSRSGACTPKPTNTTGASKLSFSMGRTVLASMSLFCSSDCVLPSMRNASVAGVCTWVRIIGTVWTQVPSSPPGSSPISSNRSMMYWTAFRPPGVPGARPSNSSEASVLTISDSRAASICAVVPATDGSGLSALPESLAVSASRLPQAVATRQSDPISSARCSMEISASVAGRPRVPDLSCGWPQRPKLPHCLAAL